MKKRYDILTIALSQIGNHDSDKPHPGRYLSGGYDWCAEFVSYVYLNADKSFTLLGNGFILPLSGKEGILGAY